MKSHSHLTWCNNFIFHSLFYLKVWHLCLSFSFSQINLQVQPQAKFPSMVKQLQDMCLGCIAQNLNTISNVGKQLPTRHKEKLLQWVVDHNMLTTDYLPHVTYHLFSPALRSVSFCDCSQISDKLLIQLDACQCRLEEITIEGCKVTGKLAF